MRSWLMPAGRAGQAGALRVTLVAGAFGAVLLGAGLPGPGRRAALAQEQPITDRDYVLDLYQGPVLGAGRMVSMGGAAVALAEGSASMLVNPAAPAIRLPTSIDEWDWDWHADWLDPSLARDYDNDGRPNEIGLGEAPLITLGAIGQYRGWGLGTSIVMGTRAIELGASSGGADQLTSSFVIGRVILAHAFERPRVTVGLGVRTVLFDVARTAMAIGEDGGQERSESRYAAGGASLEAGAVWQPVDRDLRVGAAVKLAVQGRGSSVRCDPATCDGPVPPRAVNVPWEVALGFAWRWGPTRWNRRMAGPWRDERALILTGDVVFTGPTHDGHAYEAFLDEMLRPSGRDASVSVRAGAEHEWLPGRLRVRGGSYWEPGRVEGANGRLHVTTGLEWRFWQFRFRDEPYRLRFSLTADVARDYRNGGVSIGLWH